VDFKNYLNSLDFFASFCIKAKRRREKNQNTCIHLAKGAVLALSSFEPNASNPQEVGNLE